MIAIKLKTGLRSIFFLALFVFEASIYTPAFANETFQFATIEHVRKNGHIILSDNTEIYLQGIILLPSGRRHLHKLLPKGQTLRVKLITTSLSQQDILPAEIELLPHFFLRDQLIIAGHALMFPHYLTRAEAMRLRDLEKIAQQNHTSIWRKIKHPPIISPDMADKYIGQYKIVRGKIIKHDWQEKVVYLNFANDWRTDFTVRAPKNTFQEIQQKLGWRDNLAGKIIECRGMLHKYYGAAIDLSHEGQCFLEQNIEQNIE